MPALILLVHADASELRRIERVLSSAQYLVAAAGSFKAASKLLKSVIPDLLVADASLDVFTGMQLAAVSKLDHPHLPVLIIHRSADPIFEADAAKRGFAFLGGLDDPERLLRAVRETLGESRNMSTTIRRWRRKPIPELDVRVAQPRARLVDVSYDGCRLLVADADEAAASVFDVAFHARGITLKAKRVWGGRAPGTDEFWLGAQFIESDDDQMTRWRQFVDSVG